MDEKIKCGVVISEKEYEALKKDSIFLNALEACGVDNWEGYGEAYKMVHEKDEICNGLGEDCCDCEGC
jgi:hypothetical protein